jgi:hypothetical protein
MNSSAPRNAGLASDVFCDVERALEVWVLTCNPNRTSAVDRETNRRPLLLSCFNLLTSAMGRRPDTY